MVLIELFLVFEILIEIKNFTLGQGQTLRGEERMETTRKKFYYLLWADTQSKR